MSTLGLVIYIGSRGKGMKGCGLFVVGVADRFHRSLWYAITVVHGIRAGWGPTSGPGSEAVMSVPITEHN